MEVAGIPDNTSSPVVMLNYQAVTNIVPDAAVTGPWQFNLAVLPDVVQPLCYTTSDMSNNYSTLTPFLNPQLSTVDYGTALQALVVSGAIRWRLAYMSVSLYQDGPDLSNQGTLVAGQVPIQFSIVQPSSLVTGTGVECCREVMVGFPGTANVGFPYLQAQPNAHFGPSKAGAYLPLHLDRVGKWVGVQDAKGWAATPAVTYPPGGAVGGPGIAYTINQSTSLLAPSYPYASARPTCWNPSTTKYMGSLLQEPANTKWGFIAGQNISPATRMSVYVRMGWEVMVTPASQLASLQRVGPKSDPLALECYARIVRELKDAYPVEFNDLNKLWEVIKGAARVALPALSFIPGPVGALAGAAGGVLRMFDKPKAQPADSGSMPLERDSPPAATVQRAREAIAATGALREAQQVRRKLGKKAARKRAL